MQLVLIEIWAESKERTDDINISHFTGQLQQTEYLAIHETHDTRYIASYVINKSITMNRAGKARERVDDPK